MRYAATSTNPGKTYECPAADDDYNAGAAALGPSLIMAANHPDTTQFWDYVILGLVASSRWDVQWNRYDASVAERAGRAEGKLSLTLGHQSVSPNEEGEPMQRGDRAPDFELPDETGHPRRLSEMQVPGDAKQPSTACARLPLGSLASTKGIASAVHPLVIARG